MSVTLTRLQDVTLEDKLALIDITKNEEIIKFIGTGKVWDMEYVNNLIDDATHFNWIIKYNNVVAGYVGLRPLKGKVGLQIRIFVNLPGKGIGKAALKLVEALSNTTLWAVVLPDNTPSNALFKSWQFVNQEKIYGHIHNIYRFDKVPKIAQIDLSDLPINNGTNIEIEVKFKPKNVYKFIKQYNHVLNYLKGIYTETVEQSTVYIGPNNIRKIVTPTYVTYQTKTRLSDYNKYRDYGFVISVSDEVSVKPKNFKSIYTRYRTRHIFDLGDQYELDMTEVNNNGKVIYEIELEYKGDIRDFDYITLENKILYMYKLIYDTTYMYNDEQLTNLINTSNQLLKTNAAKNISKDVLVKARNIKYTDLTYGGIVGNNVTDYVIAHKVDGLHKLLIMAPSGTWLNHGDEYNLIDPTRHKHTTIYEAELVNNDIIIYDCLIFDDKNVMAQNLDTRFSYIVNIIIPNFVISIKSYKSLNLDNFFTIVQEMIEEQDTLPYPQDGFIFTPTNQYNYNSDKLPLYERNLHSYPDVCKWKPPNRITIDFRVIINNNNNLLFYVYDTYKKQEVPFTLILPTMIDKQFYNTIYYNNIVECIYDPICKLLQPVKIRTDKDGPNKLDIAQANWKDINDPITIDDLAGKTLELVKKYHNQIKNILYGLPTIYKPLLTIEPNYNLLDIGGGRGGDISKWISSHANTVITVEPNEDNLKVLKNRLIGKKINVIPINTIGENTTDITNVVHTNVPKGVNVVSLMLSLSFFYQERLDALVNTINNNLAINGKLIFLTIDGAKLKPKLGFDDKTRGFIGTLPSPLHLLNATFTLYDNIFVRVEIPGIVGKQWEFLVDLTVLTNKLKKYHIELIETRPATDELLLSKEAKEYSSLFTYGYYQKMKDVNHTDTNIPLSVIAYPIIKYQDLVPLEEDQVASLTNTLYNNLYRIGSLPSLFHVILKATYVPYQNSNDVTYKNKLALQFEKQLNTTNIDMISQLIDTDIYILNYQEGDVTLSSTTYNCYPKSQSIILLDNDVVALNVKGQFKTIYNNEDVIIYQLRKLIKFDNNIYVDALITNMKKVFKIDVKTIKPQIAPLLTNNKVKEFTKLLNTLPILKKSTEGVRTKERVTNIDNMLKTINFDTTNLKILDIGAGNGQITLGLKNYYNLKKEDVYAIDQKLPNIKGITALTYDKDNNIPLPDNSVNLIILYAVLHHIPPEIRDNLLVNINRVLQPGSIVIIREHDDDNTESFYNFINFIHLIWYVAENETNDPLYMLNRQQFMDLFAQHGLKSIYYTSYPEPNTQHIYHQIFQKPIDDFPYKKYSILPKDLYQRLNNLKKYEFTFVNQDYTIRNIKGDFYKNKKLKYHDILIKNNKSDYLNYNLISDYFMDPCIVLAKRYDQPLNPYDYWQTYKNDIINKSLKQYGNDNAYSLREIIFQTAGEVTTFRPSLFVGFIKMFKAKKVLDFSSGWGDRLIGAIAANVDFYCGVDPNPCLHDKYNDIINFFDPEHKDRYQMIQAPFETANLPDVIFDLVLTSPPYWNLEVYSDDKNQSIYNRNLDDWFDNFLIASLLKSWSVLKSKGYLIIIINDIYNQASYTEKMIKVFNRITKDAEFLGVISYSEFVNNEPKSPQPCWIWVKK
jgi:ubiquinone/menaquinone biosynthesis C-methylase UbiE